MNAERIEKLSLLFASSAFFVIWYMITLGQMHRLCTTNIPRLGFICTWMHLYICIQI